MKHFSAMLVLALGFSALFAAAPQRIILSPCEQSENNMALAFRFYEAVDSGKVQYTLNAPDVNLHKRAETLCVATEKVFTNAGDSVLHYVCSIRLSDLQEDSEYAYRVGDGRNWSPWYTFRTAKRGFNDFTMVYLGDPQWGFETYLPRLYQRAMLTAPDAAFWFLAGDLVDYPYQDWQWDAFFRGASQAFSRYPVISAVGNHAYLWAYRDHRDTLPPNWRPHLTQPENGPEGLEETCFYVDWQGVRFIVLNGNEQLEKQAEWLKGVLKKNPNRWTVAGIHQGFYPSGYNRDYPEYRRLFIPLMEKYGVSMVLQGHDHAYTRTYPLKKDKIVDDPAKGIAYVISVAGAKQYPIQSKFGDLFAVQKAESEQYFQTLSFYADSLVYRSYTVSGDCHDHYVIRK
ncbi:MAG: metallophosphoesterase family protein [Candidatus Neomarinimicrobiota bacterium]|jgi:3',5'-cyclic AMP phosphodiesterase CpdA|nr:metallophosphoesterase family protein [Candidatus Neomarinimicrobiota bacterium]